MKERCPHDASTTPPFFTVHTHTELRQGRRDGQQLSRLCPIIPLVSFSSLPVSLDSPRTVPEQEKQVVAILRCQSTIRFVVSVTSLAPYMVTAPAFLHRDHLSIRAHGQYSFSGIVLVLLLMLKQEYVVSKIGNDTV